MPVPWIPCDKPRVLYSIFLFIKEPSSISFGASKNAKKDVDLWQIKHIILIISGQKSIHPSVHQKTNTFSVFKTHPFWQKKHIHIRKSSGHPKNLHHWGQKFHRMKSEVFFTHPSESHRGSALFFFGVNATCEAFSCGFQQLKSTNLGKLYQAGPVTSYKLVTPLLGGYTHSYPFRRPCIGAP